MPGPEGIAVLLTLPNLAFNGKKVPCADRWSCLAQARASALPLDVVVGFRCVAGYCRVLFGLRLIATKTAHRNTWASPSFASEGTGVLESLPSLVSSNPPMCAPRASKSDNVQQQIQIHGKPRSETLDLMPPRPRVREQSTRSRAFLRSEGASTHHAP